MGASTFGTIAKWISLGSVGHAFENPRRRAGERDRKQRSDDCKSCRYGEIFDQQPCACGAQSELNGGHAGSGFGTQEKQSGHCSRTRW